MAPSVTWERVAHHSHLHLLPVVAAGALVWGSLSLFGWFHEFERFLPLALTFVGAVALLGSVASYLCYLSSPGRESQEASRPPPVPSREASETQGTALPVREQQPTRDSYPSSGIGRATVSKVARVGDELWHHWSTPKPTPLGAQIVGPVPETAYSPTKPGSDAVFGHRDQEILFLPTGTTPSVTSRPFPGPAAGPGPECPPASRVVPGAKSGATSGRTESERRGPASRPDLRPEFRHDLRRSATSIPKSAEYRSGPVGAKVPNRDSEGSTIGGLRPRYGSGRTIPRALEDVGPMFSRPVGMPPILDSFDHLADLESIDPVSSRPSQPRDTTTPDGPWREARSSSQGRAVRFCTDCSQKLSDFRTWVECRVCRRPMCRHCLSESFLSDDDGSCSHCRKVRNWPVR